MDKKKTLILTIGLLFIVLLAVNINAETSFNFLTKGWADTLYCAIDGNCRFNNLTVRNMTILNTTNASEFCLGGTCVSDWGDLNGSYIFGANDSLWNRTGTTIFPAATNWNINMTGNISASWFKGNINWSYIQNALYSIVQNIGNWTKDKPYYINSTNISWINDNIYDITSDRIVWMPMGINAKDYSGYGNDGSIYGSVWHTDSGRFGGGYWFDRSSTYNTISIPYSDSLNFTKEITISVWAYPYNTSGSNAIIAQYDHTHMRRFIMYYGIDALPKRFNIILYNSTWGLANLYTINDYEWEQWHHIVATYNGSHAILYVDGAYDNSVYLGGDIAPYNWTYPTYIGASYGYSEQFKGSIDEFSIYNRSLTSNEVSKLYENRELEQVTVNTSAPDLNNKMVLWYPMSVGLQDYSDYKNDATNGGVKYNSTGGHNGFGAYQFNSSSDDISISYQPQYNFSTSNELTVSAWVYPKSNATNQKIVIHDKQANKQVFDLSYNIIPASNNGFQFYIWNLSANSENTFSPNNYTPNHWYHVVGTWNDSHACIFVNAENNASSKTCTNARNIRGVLNTVNYPIYIGTRIGYQSPFNGTIDDVRIYNRTLTDEEISRLYNYKELEQSANMQIAQINKNETPYICNSNNAGNIIFNGSLHFGCNGTGWKRLY